MATNDFLGFASNGNANIASQADYAAAAEQGIGMQPGPASSKLANKVWRQGANMAAALGRIAAARGYNALDNGDLNELQSAIDDTISVGTFNRMYFSQTSGSFTAPRTGVYRITLKGGGGGGAGGHTGPRGGSGGGEGGTLVLYRTLTKDTAYAYTIGAGGAGGAQNSSGSGGSDGGSTSITINGTTVSANYGSGAGSPGGTSNGGIGGDFSAVSDSFGIYGAPGQTGPFLVGSGISSFSVGGSGGGAGGGQGVVDSSGACGRYGGGGAGGGVYNATSYAGGDGGDGYILVEYAG